MQISLYDVSVKTYLQGLNAMKQVLKKGEDQAQQGNLDLNKLVEFRLRDDMAPFRFQLVSVWHHSLGAIKGLKAGAFSPPPSLGDLDYGQLKGLIDEAISELSGESAEAINVLAGKPLLFRVADREIPFVSNNFILSFSVPNFNFHATTAYDMLRMQGVPLGKMDYLGQLRTGN
ncbi:MAG: DUF1993 domain-containing protein [Pseudomonadota bacterium]